ncbi:hypothetical protein [Peribacillus butanolivorans]|uniref:hypothetical protein n=1 Tax=Peribacillus butanolivorans TaxID=421767 RepID=UPI0036D7CD5A
MSFPNIPNITPTISITTAQTVPLLLSSIALEELALAHIINAEAEKLQFVLGTLPTGTTLSPAVVSVPNLLAVDASVQRTLRDVIKKEILLEFKFENVLDLLTTIPPTPPPPTITCDCEVTNMAGNDFSINRGQGAAGTTVTFNGVVQDPPGGVTYNGLICSSCTPDANFFEFDFDGSGDVAAFTFTATTFTVPSCPGSTVSITGQGTTDNPGLFGATPAYTLNVDDTMNNNSITVIITGNGNTFMSTTTLGNGEIAISDCP